MQSVVASGDFRYIENCWIELSDGVRLAATLWLPASASETNRVPAVLEVLPYRKRDATAARDYQSHSYLAAKGFAGCRVDMRGSGDSEGLFSASQTYADIPEALEWLVRQPWCSGNLGMMGLSWGGINSIMAADRHAAGLKAIMVSSFSTDRYADGMLWKNACLLNRNFVWATGVVGLCSRPPDPAIVGEAWRDSWIERLENMNPEITSYLGHQRRDAYWDEHRIERAGDITCPIFMTGGWADSNYTQTLPKLLDTTKGPKRAVFGPWAIATRILRYQVLASISLERLFVGSGAGCGTSQVASKMSLWCTHSSRKMCWPRTFTPRRLGNGWRSANGRFRRKPRCSTLARVL